MRVLVVDDEPDVLALCRLNLTFDGHEVLEAPDGSRALDLAVAERPDVIVLDVMLPRWDGIALLAELERRDETTGIPVVLLSARAWREDQLRGLAAGAAAYMTKPFAPRTLAETVRRVAGMSVEERTRQRAEAARRLRATARAGAVTGQTEPRP